MVLDSLILDIGLVRMMKSSYHNVIILLRTVERVITLS